MKLKNSIVLSGLILLVAVQFLAGDTATDEKAIVDLIKESYVKAAHNRIETDLVKKGFHEKFNWQLVHHGRLFVWDLKQWFIILERDKWLRPEWNNRTSADIKVLAVAGDAAVARVDIYNDKILDSTDFLSLYKFKDGWKVSNKISQPHEAPADVRHKRHLEREKSMNDKLQPPEKVMDAIGLKPGMTVGEIGAGHGRYTVHLARRVGEGGKILANDIDKDALSVLKDRCKRESLANVKTLLGEELDPLFPKKSLDMAFMVWVFHGLDKPGPLFKNLIPALKPGAPLVIVDPVDSEIDMEREFGGEKMDPDRPTIKQRVEKAAAEGGFEIVRIETFLPKDYIFILKVKD